MPPPNTEPGDDDAGGPPTDDSPPPTDDWTTPACTPPVISIGSPQAVEGSTLAFEITVQGVCLANFTYSYTTQDGTARSGLDYHADSGALSLTDIEAIGFTSSGQQEWRGRALVSIETLDDETVSLPKSM